MGRAPPSLIWRFAIQESPIFVKTHDFVRWLLEHTIKFPKSQRFVMAKRTEDAALDFYDLLIKASKDGSERRQVLKDADLQLERIKHYLRLCVELNLLSVSQYEHASKAIFEIGKLLGGWMKKA